jgi:hypothetical protein
MTAALGAVLALAIIVQAPRAVLDGTVVDDTGKLVAGAEVVFAANDGPTHLVETPDLRTQTDASGHFRLEFPCGRWNEFLYVLVHRAGLALTMVSAREALTGPIVLRKPDALTITVEEPDGKPSGGATVSPRFVALAYGDRTRSTLLPDAVGNSLSIKTGGDGTARFDLVVPGDRLLGVFVSTKRNCTQYLALGSDRLGYFARTEIAIRLKPATRLSGRVQDPAGKAVASAQVDLWSQQSAAFVNPVELATGPIRVAADGSFQTPDSLIAGSTYRVVVRAPGMEPVLSDWVTMGAEPRTLRPLVLQALASVSGRVVDRQGQPVAGIEVFQSGDGPARTATVTDLDGRFTLGGYAPRPGFVFAHGPGFRFTGRLIKPGQRDVALELTRFNERPAAEMRMLPDALSLDESRACANRLVEPYWKDFETKGAEEQFFTLRDLMPAEPHAALRKIDGVKFPVRTMRGEILSRACEALAEVDSVEAETLANSIDEPEERCRALILVADALPETERARRLKLLENAVLQARNSFVPQMRTDVISRVIIRLCELGEKERAKALVADALDLKRRNRIQGKSLRALCAARLARVDLSEALAIVREGVQGDSSLAGRAFATIARQLAADDPAEAERIWGLIPLLTERDAQLAELAMKMAAADPGRAWRLSDDGQREVDQPQRYLLLAHALRSRDPAGALKAFQIAMDGLDRWIQSAKAPSVREPYQVVLPLVEQIDPALVPEYLWRLLALRPAPRDPDDLSIRYSTKLALLLAWYNREVAAALLEPARLALDHGKNLPPDASLNLFLAWSIIDPRAATRQLEKTPAGPAVDQPNGNVRVRVAELLRLPRAARWKKIYGRYTQMISILPGESD